MNTAAATGLLLLIAAEPELLAAAPEGADRGELTHRVREEDHLCLGCGTQAVCAVVVNSRTAGPRWLDLCSECWFTVRLANESPQLPQ
ncbi:hypothetical protein [Streptomyces albidochromogenes]|uniref:Uncharacterized protein n=1 Tax=Streptomyces albidochromogenes TaxID=329524 RepID=A0ABW6FH94_9ACTN